MQKATTITNILMMTYDICDAVAVVVRIVAAVNPYRHDEPVSAKVWPDDASCSFSVVSHTSEQRYMPLLDAWVEVLSMAPGYEGPVLTVRARGDGTWYMWSRWRVRCSMLPFGCRQWQRQHRRFIPSSPFRTPRSDQLPPAMRDGKGSIGGSSPAALSGPPDLTS